MAATIKGVTTLVFGCDVVSAVIMQSVDSETTAEIAYAQDEDGKYVAFAIPEGGKVEASGEYLFKGSDIVSALGASITLTNAVGGGGLYVYSYGRKATNTGFVRGTFKAGGIDGVS